MKKSGAGNEKLCQNKDVFERMNFLCQASSQVLPKNLELASFYNSILISCAKKAVLRLDHNLKRLICKSCHCPLISGKTCKVRLLPKKKKVLKITCLTCQHSKKVPAKRNYKLWMEQPEAIVETFDYSFKNINEEEVSDKNTLAIQNKE